MDLLEQKPLNFRYVLVKTINNEIFIFFHKSNQELNNSSLTFIEDYNLNKIDTIDAKESYTVHFDDLQEDLFNKNIINFINKFNNIEKISIICSSSPTFELIFEAKTFAEITKKTKNIYLEMENSAIRIDNTELNTIDTLEIENGIIYSNGTGTLKTKKIKSTNMKILSYNTENEDSSLNFITSESFLCKNIQVYCGSKVSILTQNSNINNYIENSKCEINSLTFFGEEYKQKDNKYERIYIKGFNKVFIDNLSIEDKVKYGSIVKLDLINEFTISKISRNINDIDIGNTISMTRTGMLEVHNVNININNESNIKNDCSIIKCIKDNSDLQKTINIYDSNIINNSNKNISLIDIKDISVNKIYMSKSNINKNSNLFRYNESTKVEKLSFNKVNIKNNTLLDISIGNKIIITDCKFIIDNDININNCNYLSIESSIIESNNININGDNIQKSVFSSSDFICNNFNIENTDFNNNNLFINDSKLRIENLNIKNFITSISGGYINFTNFILDVKNNLKLNDVTLNIRKKSTINIKTSVMGLFFIYSEINKSSLDFIINDNYKFLTNNSITVIDKSESKETSPSLNFKINLPSKIEITSLKSDFIHIGLLEKIEVETPTNIYLSDSNSKVILDNPKYGQISNVYKDDLNRNSYKILKLD